MAKLWDAHMHTDYSGDSEAPVTYMLEEAKKRGLIGVTITDHLDWDYQEDPGLFDLNVPLYLQNVGGIASDYTSDDFSVAVGIELGLQEHLAERHRELLAENHFDYVIGSIHVVNGRDPYYDPYFEGRSPRECYCEYLDCMLSNLQSFSDIDALGHLDYIVRYAISHFGVTDAMMNYTIYEELISAILSFLIKKDIALEINTGAYRNGMSEPNPSFDIIRAYYNLGGRLITIGADAHKPEDIALGFDDLPSRLRYIGFSSYAVFTDRKITERPL